MEDKQKIAKKINEKALKIQALYQSYFNEIKRLRLRQEDIVLNFIKIEKIRDNIKNNF